MPYSMPRGGNCSMRPWIQLPWTAPTPTWRPKDPRSMEPDGAAPAPGSGKPEVAIVVMTAPTAICAQKATGLVGRRHKKDQ